MKTSIFKRAIFYKFKILFFVLIIGSIVACNTTTEVSADSNDDQTAQAGDFSAREISASKVCGKCNMFPAKFVQWQAQVVFSDGVMVPFDGCKCMFSYLLDMEKYTSTHTKSDVAAVWVKDFNDGSWQDAESVFFVIGSSVMGPMGKQLIPFSQQADADKFQQENGGSIGRYSDITMATLMPLSVEKTKMKM